MIPGSLFCILASPSSIIICCNPCFAPCSWSHVAFAAVISLPGMLFPHPSTYLHFSNFNLIITFLERLPFKLVQLLLLHVFIAMGNTCSQYVYISQYVIMHLCGGLLGELLRSTIRTKVISWDLKCQPHLGMTWMKRVTSVAGNVCMKWLADTGIESPDCLVQLRKTLQVMLEPDFLIGMIEAFVDMLILCYNPNFTPFCFLLYFPTGDGHNANFHTNLRVCYQGNPIWFFGLLFMSPIVNSMRARITSVFPTSVFSVSGIDPNRS